MFKYILKHIASLFFSLFIASIVIFGTIELLPGNAVSAMLGMNVADDTLKAYKAMLGIDASIPVQYWRWIMGVLQGDFGISYTYKVPVKDIIIDRMWVSIPLTLYALTLMILVSFPLGLISAIYKGSIFDRAVMGISQLGVAFPNFWLAILLVLLFSVLLRWFPAGGFRGWDAVGFYGGIKALTLPAISLAIPQASILVRTIRISMLDTIGADFMRTARAKGLGHCQTVLRHGVRNALIPFFTIIGLQISFLLAGAVIIENVFFLSGLGRLIFQSVIQRDLVVVKNVVLLFVAVVIMVHFILDIIYGIIDPRLRRA